MKTCLGCCVLMPVLAAAILTLAYHVVVNTELEFERRDPQSEYINTRRSYRPPVRPRQVQQPPAPTAPTAPAGNTP